MSQKYKKIAVFPKRVQKHIFPSNMDFSKQKITRIKANCIGKWNYYKHKKVEENINNKHRLPKWKED